MKGKISALWIVWTMLFCGCDSQPYKQGAILYSNFCESCHMKDGSGLAQLIPPLANADYLKENPDKTACIIKYGMSGAITVNGKVYNQPMPAVKQLSDAEIANVINYIYTALNNDLPVVTMEEVKAALNNCK